MDKSRLLEYLKALDETLSEKTELVVYGSAAFILLDEDSRTSLDIDVAAPYSRVNYPAFCRAAESSGLPVNPPEDTLRDHIEWIPPLRLCLKKPSPDDEVVLWRGKRLTVKTVSAADLIASKLIRYDPIDQADIQYVLRMSRISFEHIQAAASALPAPFNTNPLVLENLENLKNDLRMWMEKKP
ncbi:MAG: DUF6036 family nucleotidyltransferase [Kiritimatiellae bacterium]|nr:DUF6036 family nucleotidyltransferase [Kiritimatiellia bacterium]